MYPPRLTRVVTAFLLAHASLAAASQIAITGPAGSGQFGKEVFALSSGNLVVTDPLFDNGATADVGAVHVLKADGTLLSTIKGSTANDQVGELVRVLPNGNFVIQSPKWDNGAIADAGAVTWVNGSTGATITGINATVAPSNSLVGSKTNDFIFAQINDVGSGNYIVRVSSWDNGTATNAGAIIWANGSTGIAGAVSAANALIGSKANDNVGNTISVLPNGNYVSQAFSWDNGATTDVGAVTFCEGNTGRTGAVGGSNSLIGGTAGDQIGSALLVLANGNFIVRNFSWHNGAAANAGAVTWGSGTAGIATGVVSSSNSLTGTKASDFVGGGNIALLTNGNYAVCSPIWDNGATVDAGAVTWGNGTTGTVGAVGTSNSLTGSTSGDRVGDSIVALTNGHYVTGAPNWDNGATTDVGAATWCSGFGPTVAPVQASNSLIGTITGSRVSNNTPVALTNGNYVVLSSGWKNSGAISVGAVTWSNGATGTTGFVSDTNSLVGTTASDTVGSRVTPLPNGNYVASSTSWNNAGASSAGHVTLCSGTGPAPVGAVTPANSLVGSTNTDQVGDIVTVVGSSNYIVSSKNWDNGAAVDTGAVTWANGTTGIVGPVSAANSLVGTNSNDAVGTNVAELDNGNYVVHGTSWSSPVSVAVGFASFGNGNTGVTGPVSSLNSLVGNGTNDRVSDSGVLTLPNGDYLLLSDNVDNGGLAVDAGMVARGNGGTGLKGAVSASNSLLGSKTNDRIGRASDTVKTFADGSVVAIHRLWDNGTTVDAGAVTLLRAGASPPVGAVTVANSILGTVASGGSLLSATYDPDRQLLVVGKPAENVVILQSPGTGKAAFATAITDVLESAGTAIVKVNRIGGTEGTLVVNVSTTSAGGTATAGADYTPITNQVLTFGPGVARLEVPVTILTDAVTEKNETFKLVLTPSTAVVAPSTTMVRIITLGDITPPSAPVIMAPASNARVPANPGDNITISGTAVDENGLLSVQVRLNGSVFTNATLTNHTGKTASWSIALPPQTGANTIEVRTLDTNSNIGPVTTRTFVCTRPLVVNALGGFGTFTVGFAGRSFREPGKLIAITAVPSTGFLFKNWTVSGGPNASLANIGLTAAQLELPTLSFIFKESLTLTANFAPNPFVSTTASGIYNGIILPDPNAPDRVPLGSNSGEDGTSMSNATTGSITVTVLGNATFTGRITIDGLTLPIAGNLDPDGNARFGAMRERSLFVPRAGRAPLKLEMGVSTSFLIMFGSVSDVDAVSSITALHANYSATNPVPPSFLTATGGSQIYNAAFTVLPVAQPSGLTADRFPQGSGVGTFTVTKTGSVTLAGVLADGTAVTSSGTLDFFNNWKLYSQLYNKLGFIMGSINVDPTQTNTDASGAQLDWVRPILDDQHYPVGWPAGIQCQLRATKLTIPTSSSVLPGLPVLDANGNADLKFSEGLLSASVFKQVGISSTDTVLKPLPVDNSFSLSIVHTTGKFSGTFTHPLGVTPYQGIILQKGTNRQGLGFFKTKAPAVKDYLGQSGNVLLSPQ